MNGKGWKITLLVARMQGMKRLLPVFAFFFLAACFPQRNAEIPPIELIPTNASSALPAQDSSPHSPKPDPDTIPVPSSVSPKPLPSSATLSVPFSPQAPLANWDPLHEESCEEMSLIMVHHFLAGTALTRDGAEQEIQDLVKWETEHGYPMDVTVKGLGEIAEKYYRYRSEVIENPTEEKLKRLLSDGHPVIVPAAGRDLNNPYFSGDGPWYHMLVLTGYGWWHFVTNDPGTRRGEGYEYRFGTLMNAIHDWTGVKEEIRKGRSAVLVLEKKQ